MVKLFFEIVFPGYIKRVIVHPSFKNVAFKEAEKKLAGMEQGECIVRPSSKVKRMILWHLHVFRC